MNQTPTFHPHPTLSPQGRGVSGNDKKQQE